VVSTVSADSQRTTATPPPARLLHRLPTAFLKSSDPRRRLSAGGHQHHPHLLYTFFLSTFNTGSDSATGAVVAS
jgi:hypothetical protein